MVAMHNVLIVGAGSIGERHARCFSQTGRARAAIVETAAPRREAMAAQYGWNAYASLDAALDAESWSTVVIATPANTHVDLTLRCLERGLPVLIEKPLAVQSAQVEPLLRYVRADSPAVGVAYVHRAHPAVAAGHEAVTSGRFGKPLQLVATLGQHFPTFRPAYASTYYARHDTGGGAIQDALTHTINTAEWLVGPITRLAADAQHLVLPHVEVEDTVHLMARHGAVMASYSQTQHQAHNEATVTVVCERGSVRIDLLNNRWRWQTDPKADWTDVPTPLNSRDAWFELQSHAWLNTVEGAAEPLCSLDEAYQTLLVNETALRSVREDGAWLDVHNSHATPTRDKDH